MVHMAGTGKVLTRKTLCTAYNKQLRGVSHGQPTPFVRRSFSMQIGVNTCIPDPKHMWLSSLRLRASLVVTICCLLMQPKHTIC